VHSSETSNMKRRFLDIFKNLWGGKEKKKGIHEHFNASQIAIFSTRLEELMSQRKPFLKQRYSIKDMATDIQVPSYQLSAFLNNVLKTNFSDYLNKFRIEYCENLMKDKNHRVTNFKQLASECGFNNRNTFTTAFKKFTGKTPSDYVKKLLSDDTMSFTK
jgi:YesN/AraC family two-component response regulator